MTEESGVTDEAEPTRFLVAVDGSEPAHRAVQQAVDLAADVGGTVTLVHAVHPDVYGDVQGLTMAGPGDVEDRLILESVSDAEADGQRVIDDAVEAADDPGVIEGGELVYGDPVEAIPRFAETEGFDVIYLGHRGLSPREESMLGSVAKGVVERATVQVTVVP